MITFPLQLNMKQQNFRILRYFLFTTSLFLSFQMVGQMPYNMVNALYGKQSNGFRYVVKEGPLPTNRINFRLIMTIGSQQEQEGEEGAAHFIEHLAFRNTVHYPNGGIVKKLESLGEKYGITINAYTGYDRTIYMFSVPSNIPEALPLGIKIVSEWLSHISLDNESVSNEKPIIFEEIAENRSNNCFDRLKKGTNPCLHRFPIGTIEQVENITPQVLESFYRRNYQPQNAALIIVGANINKEKTEKLIKKTFGKLSGNSIENRFVEPLQYNPQEVFEACDNKNATNATIEWIYPVIATPLLTTEQLINNEKNSFVMAMLNTRLRKKGNPLRITKQWYLNRTEHLCFEVSGKNDSILLHHFRKGISVIEGVRQKGFSKHECKMQLKSFFDTSRARNFNYTSAQWCDFFTDILLTESRNISTIAENDLITKAIEKVTLNEWNQCLSDLLLPMKEKALLGYSFSSEHHKSRTYNDFSKAFYKALENPDTLIVKANPKKSRAHCSYDISFLNNPIKNILGKAINTTVYPRLGIEELCLKNGARLILKQTANIDSTVFVSLIFQGGLAEIPRKKYPLLESAAAYMSIGGIESIDNDVYSEVLTENSLSVINTVETYWHGMLASGKTNNMRQLANLIIKRCFYPKKCYKDFDEIKMDLRAEKEENDTSLMTRLVATTPTRMLRKRVDEVAGNSLSYSPELTTNDIDKLNLDSIAAFYHHIYTRSTNLTCIVTGKFDMENAKYIFTEMLRQFVPSQQTIQKKHIAVPITKTCTIKKVANNPQIDRLSFNYLYCGNFLGGLRQILILKLMREIIRNRAINEIRNNAGLIYSPYVDLHYHTHPSFSFCFDINGTVNASNALIVKAKIEAIVSQLQIHQPSKAELDALKQSFLLTKDSFLTPEALPNWREYLTKCVKEHISFTEAEEYELILKTITPKDMLLAFQKLIKPTNRIFLYTGNLYENNN